MKLNNTPIYVGTSGYSYDDWKGNFFPENMENHNYLDHYVKSGLNFLEITYTFYKMPLAEKIQGICDRVGDDVKLSLRLNKSLLRKKPDSLEIKMFKDGITPAIESGKVVALFGDFHHLFSASRENFDIIKELKDQFPEIPLYVELTNSTWHKGKFYEEFKANEIGLVVVDGPKFRGFAPYYPICSNGGVYFRLYGKNPLWLSGTEKMLDYNYSESELNKFIRDGIDFSALANNIYVSFCNVEKGNAPKNALEFINLMNKK